jgi:hypothetical protein
MAKRYVLASMLVFLCLVLCASSAWAQWVKDGTVVCYQPYSQIQPRTISDGRGGVIMAWMDSRSVSTWDIYINRVDSTGDVNAEDGGLPVCVAAGDQMEHRLIPDGTGGAIVVWLDNRVGDYDIYAQRINGEGIVQWALDGIPICAASGNQALPRIVPDGIGGAIIVWSDYRGGQYDTYAQRVNAAGDTLWAANGIPIDASVGDQYGAEVIPDGSGGAYLIWMDSRNGGQDLYAQRIDGDGNLLWGADALPVCLAGGSPSTLGIVATTDASVFVSWTDYRNAYGDIFVQKIDEDGLILGPDDGLAVCPESWNKYGGKIVSDGSGGAIVAWYDQRNTTEVYAQRIDTNGNLVWLPAGNLVFPSYGDGDIAIIADGSGGAILGLDIYLDEFMPNDVYAQKLDADGNLLWGPRGSAVCLAPNNQYDLSLIPDGLGGAIIAWDDYRDDPSYSDIYCQRVGASGVWGFPEPRIVSCFDVPMDQGGWVRLRTRASSHDVAEEFDTPILGYNVWRLIGGGGPLATSANAANADAAKAPAIERSKLMALLADPATAKGIRVGGPEAVSLGLPPGDWEAVGFWLATRDTIYYVTVPTKNDSTAEGVPIETFIVTAHMPMAGVFVVSEPAWGYSVDNLAPGVTPGFAGSEIASPPGLELSWERNSASDIWKYNIHRGDDEFFVPDGSNQIGTTESTQLIDGTWVKAFTYFYKLVAVDRHGNAGPASLLRPGDIKVGTMLQSFAASLTGAAVRISWKLSEVDEKAEFHVLRANAGGEFAELSSAGIARDGLSYAFEDETLEPGSTYRYRVNVAEGAASRTLFETDAISTPAMPLTLHQNHPNPFNPSTTIGYYLPVDSPVTLEVYDSSGRLVARLLNGAKQAKGTHSAEWSGLDAQGRSVSSGLYFYRLTSGKETISKKMVLLR